MEQISFKVSDFEGPLDLLLVLIRKNKVSIYDIPINLLVDQYFDVMRQMKEYDIDVSSEFLVLAATLLQIKSRMLLPKPVREEEGDPAEELVRRLEEYKKIKAASEYLSVRKNIGDTMFFHEAEPIQAPPPEWNDSRLTPENLVLAYKRAYLNLSRRLPPPKQSFEGIVGHEKVSVRERVRNIWTRLKSRSRVMFKELFLDVRSRSEAVASFLAVLEMIKVNRIAVEYDEDGDVSNPTVILTQDGELDLSDIED